MIKLINDLDVVAMGRQTKTVTQPRSTNNWAEKRSNMLVVKPKITEK
jgi:hypothetical protein